MEAPASRDLQAEENLSELQKIMTDVRFERLTSPELANKKVVYIMRGVPGSGKSSVAHEIVHPSGVIHSTDSKFYTEQGEYKFDPQKLPEHHDQNYEDFRGSLISGVPLVILDNTNIKKWHYARYVEAAEAAGYVVKIIEIPFPDPQTASERNVHGVSKDAIEKMIAEYERG